MDILSKFAIKQVLLRGVLGAFATLSKAIINTLRTGDADLRF